MQKLSIKSSGDVYEEIKSFIHQKIPASSTIRNNKQQIFTKYICVYFLVLTIEKPQKNGNGRNKKPRLAT